MRIISIDPSLRSTGVYKNEDGMVGVETISMQYDRIQSLVRYLEWAEREAANDWDLLIIENYGFGSVSRSVTTQAEIGGIIRAAFLREGVKVLELPIPTWKAYAKSRGFFGLKKDTEKHRREYVQKCLEIFDVGCTTSDEVDACIFFETVLAISKGKTTFGAKLKTYLDRIGIKL